MNILIEHFEDKLPIFDEKMPYLCLEYYNNGVKLSIKAMHFEITATSKRNMVCFEIQNISSIDRYRTFNNMLFYAGSIVDRIRNNGDHNNVQLDWIDFCTFTTKIHLWLASH